MAYQTSPEDAAALVNNWIKYAGTPGKAFADKDINYWIEQVRKNGSAAAWGQFEKQNPGATGRVNAANSGVAGQMADPVAYTMTLPTGGSNGQTQALAGKDPSGFDKWFVEKAAPVIQPLATGIIKSGLPVVGKAVVDAAGKLPGVEGVVGKIGDIGQKIADSPLGQGWDKHVAQPIQDATNGMHLPKLPGVSGLPSLGDVGDFVTGNNGLNLLGIGQGVNAAMLGQKSADYADKAQKAVQGAWDAKAALRGPDIINRIANPRTPNLTGLDAMRTGANPFAKPMPGVMPATGGM